MKSLSNFLTKALEGLSAFVVRRFDDIVILSAVGALGFGVSLIKELSVFIGPAAAYTGFVFANVVRRLKERG